MFESFVRNSELENQKSAEKRQMDFTKEQNLTGSMTHPADDQTYISEQDRRSDLIRWQQEMDEEVFDLILNFLSLIKIENNKIIPAIDEEGVPLQPLCNRLFIHQAVRPLLKPYLSKNLINSNLDDKDIREMQKLTADELAGIMADNWDTYNIEFSKFDNIVRPMKTMMRAACNRALKGWTKKTDSSMIKKLETEGFGNEESQKKGMLKNLFGS